MLALERAGLLAIDAAGTPPAVWVSPALQAAVRAAAPPDLLDRAARAAADALAEVWPAGQPRSWLAAALRSCAASLRQAAGDALWDGGGCHRLLLAAGHSLDAAGLTGPAVTWWRELAAGSDRLLGPGHPDTVLAGGLLAGALLAAGQAAEAVTWFRWVAGRTRRASSGPITPAPSRPRSAWAARWSAAGQPGEALAVLDEAARHSERVRGPGDAGDPGRPGRVRRRVAWPRARPPRRSACYQRSLAGRERLHGPEDPGTLAARLRLAGALLAAGQDQGRHRPAQEGPGRPGARPGPGSPGHAGGPRRPGRRLRRRRADEQRAAAAPGGVRRVRTGLRRRSPRTPWPAARTWPTPTPPRASSARR